MKALSPYILPAFLAGGLFVWLAVDAFASDSEKGVSRRFAFPLLVFALYPFLEILGNVSPNAEAARTWMLISELQSRVATLVVFEAVTPIVTARGSVRVVGARTAIYGISAVTGAAAALALFGIVPRDLVMAPPVRIAGLWWEVAGPLAIAIPLFMVIGSYVLLRVWAATRAQTSTERVRAIPHPLRGALIMLGSATAFTYFQFYGGGIAGGVPFSFIVNLLFVGMAFLVSVALRRHLVIDLRTQRDMGTTILNTMGDGLMLCDSEGSITLANRRLAEMSGYSSTELVGSNAANLFAPADGPVLETEAHNASSCRGEPQRRTLKRSDSTNLPVLSSCVPRYDADGRCVGFVNALTDVSAFVEVTDRLERRTKELSGLYEMAAAAGQSLDVRDVLTSTLDVARRLMHMKGGAAFALNEEKGKMELVARIGSLTAVTRQDFAERCLIDQLIEERTPVFCEDMSKASSAKRMYPREHPKGSYIGIPLIAKGRLLGAMCLVSPEPRSFGDDEKTLAAAMGSEVGVYVENATLFEEAGRRGVELLLLHETSKLIVSDEDDQALHARIVEKCCKAFGADLCMFLAVSGKHFRYEAVHCAQEQDRKTAEKLLRMPPRPVKGSLAEGVLSDHEAVVSNSGDGPNVRTDPAAACLRGRRWGAVPVVSNSAVIGVIVLAKGDPAAWITARDVFTLQEVANQIGRAAERARLFAEIEESERRYRLLIESASDGVFLCDAKGRMLFASQRTADIMGVPLDSLLGVEFATVFDQESGDAMAAAIAEVIEVPETTRIVDGVFTRGGDVKVPVQVACSGLDLSDGVFAVQGILRDLSSEVEAEQVKSDLVSMVSHELRSPLTLIAGYNSMLQRKDLAADPQKRAIAVAAVDTQVQRMMELIEDLLLASSIQHGPVETKKQPVNLAHIAAGFARAYKSSSDRHSVCTEFPSDFPEVYADPRGMEQVLANLLSNAIKYSPDGGRVVVSGTVDDGYVNVRVSDEGIGIDLHEREKIFARFYQADMTSKRGYGGIGLGLYLSKNIIEAHGGTIAVESDPGKGSSFTLRLPVFSETGAAAPRTPRRRGRRKGGHATHKQKSPDA